jgi:hypothetical protein
VVGSQITNLTLGLSFDHNLCFKCSNGQYKPILDIYASINFQWNKKIFKEMSFDPCDCALKIWESFWNFNSQHGSLLGSVRVHSLTLFALSGACEVTPRSPSWPTTLQPLALVASPRLGLRHGWQCILFHFPSQVSLFNILKLGSGVRNLKRLRPPFSSFSFNAFSKFPKFSYLLVLQSMFFNLIFPHPL